MKNLSKARSVYLLVCYFVLLTRFISADGTPESKIVDSKKDTMHVEIDWTTIKIGPDRFERRVIIDGFLSLEGIKDSPRIMIWETEEAMKHKRVFRSILIDPESAMGIIGPQLGWGPEGWGVLNGAFVTITASLERQERGLEFISLGNLTDIENISVYNNGLLLKNFDKKKSAEGDTFEAIEQSPE